MFSLRLDFLPLDAAVSYFTTVFIIIALVTVIAGASFVMISNTHSLISTFLMQQENIQRASPL
jgi:hypothetical protein